MPRSWENVFDIVVAHQSFRYMLKPQLALCECVRVLNENGIFAGYIGTVEEEKRLFYNSALSPKSAKKIMEARTRYISEYNVNFEDILLHIQSEFRAKISYIQEDSIRKPHKISLVKKRGHKEILSETYTG